MNMMEREAGRSARRPPSADARAPGPRIYNLFPLLVGTVSAWTAELPRIARDGLRLGLRQPVPRDRRLRQPLRHQGPVPPRPALPRRGASDDDAQIRRLRPRRRAATASR